MTKDVYLLIRDLPTIPIRTWYEYYLERGGFEGEAEFEARFYNMLRNEPIIQVTDGVMKQITLKSAYDNFYNYYNEKFGL